MRIFWERKIVQPLLDLLAQGMTSEEIALSVALGVVLGVFPILGFPTLFCVLAALVLRLNAPALQFVNYLVYPLQLALLIPFVRLGGWLFHPTPASSPMLGVLAATLHTVVAWFCVCAPAGLLLYVFLAAVLRRSSGPGAATQWIIKIGRNRKAECPTLI
jgi:uncharacterized protein (DUF2062 family)